MAQFFLDYLEGERAGAQERFDGELVRVGRGDESDVLFDEMGVSWEHAELRLRDGDWWLVDRGSTNGTFINDERAHNARLKDGDVLRFGKKGPKVAFRLQARPGSDELPVTSSANRKGRARRPRVPSEIEVQVPRLDELEPDRRHSDLPPAAALLGGRGVRAATAATVLLGLGFLGALTVLALLYVERDALGTDVAKLRDELGEARAEYRTLEGQVSELVASARQDGRLEALREARQVEEELRQRALALEAEASQSGQLRRRVEALEGQLQTVRDDLRRARAQQQPRAGAAPAASWSELEQRLERSLVLVVTQVDAAQADGARTTFTSYGSGFFVSSQGHVITSKRAVQPWKFRELAERMAREGYTVVEGSWRVHVWPAGARVRAVGGGFDLSNGYSTARHSLEVVRTAPDRWLDVSLGEGGPRLLRVHEPSGGEDLALLRARTLHVDPLPLGRSASVDRLEEVLVLGFPSPEATLRRGLLEPAASVAEVQEVDEAIRVAMSAALVDNAGGPLVDRSGRVVGISTGRLDKQERATCLKVEHAVQLLHGGAW